MYTSPSRFIDDLVPLILESDNHWWPRDLIRLARVSPAWLGPVRRRLYACPALHSFRACCQLAWTLQENPCFLPLLQGIDLRPVNGPHSTPLVAREMAGLRYILSLDGLQCVTLGGELAVGAERFLHLLINSHTVTELHIDGNLLAYSLSCRASLEWDEGMAFKFPSLRKLKLSSLELDIIYPSMPSPLQVTELVLSNVDITNGYLIHLFHHSISLRHLYVLTGSAVDFDEQVRVMLDSCTLQSLHYEVRGDMPSDQPIFDNDSSSCPSLHHLHLSGVEIDLETLSCIGQRCQNLKQLSISGRIVRVAPVEWATFIKSGALPLLRHLKTPWGTNYPPFQYWSEDVGILVLEASAFRDIHLSCPLDPRPAKAPP